VAQGGAVLCLGAFGFTAANVADAARKLLP